MPPPPRWLDALRHALYRRLLPPYLPTRRWFAAKARSITGINPIAGHVVTSSSDRGLVVEYVRVHFDDANSQVYQLPLQICQNASNDTIGSFEWDAVVWQVTDGVTAPDFTAWLLLQLDVAGEVAIENGRLRSIRVGAAAPPDFSTVPHRLNNAQQSHSNIVLGDVGLLKAFRKLDAGLNPEIELGRFLSEHTTFRDMPRLYGALELDIGEAESRAVAMLQSFVPSRGQGWEWMRGIVAGHLSRDLASPAAEDDDAWTGEVHELARQTARLHAALASVGNDPEFAPEPFDAVDAARVAQDIAAQLNRTRACLPQAPIEAGVRAEAHSLLDRIDSWLQADRIVKSTRQLGCKMRVHGDYHLGQTLRTDHTYVILDFEGEPGKNIAERRRKQSPLRDVAGMLRSLDYVSNAAAQVARERVGDDEGLDDVATRWSRRAQTLFASQYRAHLEREAPELIAPDDLLRAFLMEKALYELEYEVNNRPDWVAIPLAGLRSLAS